MKHLFTVILISTTVNVLQAQTITLSETYNPKIGDRYTSYFALFQSGQTPDPKTAGANQTWDYSNYVTDIDSSYGNFVEALPASRRVAYPFANVMVRSSYGDTTYYEANVAGFNNWGYISSQLGSTKYDDGQLLLKYPLAYGQFYEDSLKGNSSVKFNGAIVKSYRKAKAVATVDGYGSLLLPNNTSYSNVVRVKSVATGVDDLGPGYGAFRYVSTVFTYYNWYAAGINYPVFSIIDAEISNGIGRSSYAIISGPYVEPPTGVKQRQFENAMQVTPNPAYDIVNFSLVDANKSCKVTIKDLTGKALIINEPATGIQQINVSYLMPGMYLLEAVYEGVVATKKFIKN